MLGDGTCEGAVCDLNAVCVALNDSVDPEKECRCKAGYTGKGIICNGQLFDLIEKYEFDTIIRAFIW